MDMLYTEGTALDPDVPEVVPVDAVVVVVVRLGQNQLHPKASDSVGARTSTAKVTRIDVIHEVILPKCSE